LQIRVHAGALCIRAHGDHGQQNEQQAGRYPADGVRS
jgi:hypothetical protein